MVQYNDRIVGRFLQLTLGWGLFGILLGLYASLELAAGVDAGRWAFLSFGRLQALHADLLFFGLAGNALFAGFYYALQRLCEVRLWSDGLAKIHLWSWQLFLLLSLISLSLGYTQGRPLAEMEWPLDLMLLVIWGLFAGNVCMTLKRRRTKALYVSLWFLLASLLGFPLVHIVNALVLPMTLMKSDPILVGLSDAFLQLWYKENALTFFLVMPLLGLMYYFVPKLAERPIYSYRLAVMQFWALLFCSLWIAPRQMLYTSLAEWVQSLGVVFALMLLVANWGAVLNGLQTIGRNWRKIGLDPALAFFSQALVLFGIWTLLEALSSFKSTNLVLQYTSWMSGLTHLAGAGWVSAFIFGMAYVLVPKLWQAPLHKRRLGSVHAALHGLSVAVLVAALGAAGLLQGLRSFAAQDNAQLSYPEFLATLQGFPLLHLIRLGAGLLFLIGCLLAAGNFFLTARRGQLQDLREAPREARNVPAGNWRERMEQSAPLYTLALVVTIILGSLTELLTLPDQQTALAPYSPLALQGREIYLREGCASCHTQVVRVALKEELRYGPSSQFAEYQQDRPALWGQRRYGPDLHHLGGKYPDLLLYQRLTSPVLPMPAYPWLVTNKVDLNQLPKRWEHLKKLGVAYGQEDPVALYEKESKKIQASLASAHTAVDADSEIVALIAYLQKLGKAP